MNAETKEAVGKRSEGVGKESDMRVYGASY